MDMALEALVGLIEVIIRWVDDRYGRAAAWAVAVSGCAAMLAIPLLVLSLLFG